MQLFHIYKCSHKVVQQSEEEHMHPTLTCAEPEAPSGAQRQILMAEGTFHCYLRVAHAFFSKSVFDLMPERAKNCHFSEVFPQAYSVVLFLMHFILPSTGK